MRCQETDELLSSLLFSSPVLSLPFLTRFPKSFIQVHYCPLSGRCHESQFCNFIISWLLSHLTRRLKCQILIRVRSADSLWFSSPRQGYGFPVSQLFDMLLEMREQYGEILLKRWNLTFRYGLPPERTPGMCYRVRAALTFPPL